jgi:lipopolysaccharide biosynthesis glycosyltransferase
MKVFIGWDSREEIAYEVAKYTIQKYSPDIEVVPVKTQHLGEFYTRKDKLASSEFTLTRFLVPYLSNYKGLSLFLDCDILCRTDIRYLLDYINLDNMVSCVQHDYTPKTKVKMDGQVQHEYPRKNWSSVMLFNNEKCKMLTPELVNEAKPSYLHQMKWAQTAKIGSLPVKWNYLVGYYNNHRDYANILHYTDGGPWFEEYKNCEYSEEWLREKNNYEKTCVPSLSRRIRAI